MIFYFLFLSPSLPLSLSPSLPLSLTVDVLELDVLAARRKEKFIRFFLFGNTHSKFLKEAYLLKRLK
jgi:hypothetical protein